MSKRTTADCGGCPEPIDTSKPHVTYTRHLETEERGEVTVHDADVLERRHIDCNRGR